MKHNISFGGRTFIGSTAIFVASLTRELSKWQKVSVGTPFVNIDDIEKQTINKLNKLKNLY